MNLDEIKAATLEGKQVCWVNDGYEVRYNPGMDPLFQWNIVFTPNGNTISLTWSDMVTMHGEPEDFYIKSNSAPIR